MYKQLCRKEMKENSDNHRTKSTKVQGRIPFQDVTNEVESRISSYVKRGVLITGTKCPIYPSGISIQSSTSSTGHKGIVRRNASEHKRYHDRERYVKMTAEQRDAYLGRNREYKRRRKNRDAYSDGVQSAASQTNKMTNDNTHTTALASRLKEYTEVGSLNVSTSDKILPDNIVSPVIRSQIMINACDTSTSCNNLTSTGQNKRMSMFLKSCSKYKRMRMSNAAGCSTTAEEAHDYVCASASIGQCKWTNTDMRSNFKRKRSSDEASCSSARKDSGNLYDECIPLKMQKCTAVREHEDHDSIIYVPKGTFPATEDDSGLAEGLVEDDYEDDESYMLRGQGSGYLSYRDVNHVICDKRVDPGDHIYRNIPGSHHVLEPVPNCAHCGAKRFQYDKPMFCCMGGKVKIVTPRVPDEVRRLYTSQDPDAKYFRDNIRYFNSHFSFTSLGVILDQRYCNKRSGVYTFRAQGQIYHRVDQLVPVEDGPKHLQLYFYDTDAELQHRFRYSPNLDKVLIQKWARILQSNPYAQVLRSLGSVSNLDEYRIELNTDISLDQRVYNAPTASQVAAIWVEGNNPRGHFDRSIMVYDRSDDPQYIKAYHGCYDPLSYPLFFPRGEVGWNLNIPKVRANVVADVRNQEDDLDEGLECNSGSSVSPREYYCFKLQLRAKEFNILLFGKRITQQYIVDMYIKIE